MHCFRQTIFRLIPLFAAFVALVFGVTALAQNANSCGDLKNHYGPFDYRTDRGEKLDIVNRRHFTPEIEALVRGKTGSIGGDLSYTLNTFPNHHRALLSMMRYGQRLKSPQPKDAQYTVECYFERALRFRPDDTTVRMMYATFLSANSRRDDALAQLDRVGATASDNPFTQYNVGLIYLDMKEYDKALKQAHIAMALGFPQTGLKDKLVEIGKWQEPIEPLIPATSPQ